MRPADAVKAIRRALFSVQSVPLDVIVYRSGAFRQRAEHASLERKIARDGVLLHERIGLCLTAFLQSTILIAGLMVFKDHALMGVGLMLSAGEVPRIAGSFGLDTTTRANIMSAVYTAQSAVNVTRTIAAAIK